MLSPTPEMEMASPTRASCGLRLARSSAGAEEATGCGWRLKNCITTIASITPRTASTVRVIMGAALGYVTLRPFRRPFA